MNLALLAAAKKLGWLPPAATTAAGKVDFIFRMIFWVCAFFFLLIVVLTAMFVLRYRARRWSAPRPSASHNTRLELLWTIIPAALAVLMFGASAAAYLDLSALRPGAKAAEIQVTARKWSWWFDHPGGRGSNELHVVAGEPTRLVVSATDVLHSLYIPAFRVKQDAVPGRYTKLVFTAIEPGTYPIFCAEYCGTNHSMMTSAVVVHRDRAAYAEWIKGTDDSSLPLVEVGKRVFMTKGCIGCHSNDGTPRAAPTFKGLWGKSETTIDGVTITVDENYVRESIVDPRAKVVIGFQPIMPPTPLEERQFLGIIEYMKSLIP